jgi:hypothetical protein
MLEEEFWILDGVKLCGDTIEMLASENCESAFNKKKHNMSLEKIEEILLSLFNSGLIKARYLYDDRAGFVDSLTSHEIKQALLGNLKIYYFLTEKGGKTWEEYVKPDWSKYIDEYFDPDNSIVKITSANVMLINELLRIEYQFPPDNHLSSCILSETVEWEMIYPWQATYWKYLPSGLQISFKVTDSEIHYYLSDQEIAMRDIQLLEWFSKKKSWCKVSLTTNG